MLCDLNDLKAGQFRWQVAQVGNTFTEKIYLRLCIGVRGVEWNDDISNKDDVIKLVIVYIN